MASVFARLEELSIRPVLLDGGAAADQTPAADFIAAIVRRAEELEREWAKRDEDEAGAAAALPPPAPVAPAGRRWWRRR